jgi:hypothetical protein
MGKLGYQNGKIEYGEYSSRLETIQSKIVEYLAKAKDVARQH